MLNLHPHPHPHPYLHPHLMPQVKTHLIETLDSWLTLYCVPAFKRALEKRQSKQLLPSQPPDKR